MGKRKERGERGKRRRREKKRIEEDGCYFALEREPVLLSSSDIYSYMGSMNEKLFIMRGKRIWLGCWIYLLLRQYGGQFTLY